jgi:hypothetical protein
MDERPGKSARQLARARKCAGNVGALKKMLELSTFDLCDGAINIALRRAFFERSSRMRTSRVNPLRTRRLNLRRQVSPTRVEEDKGVLPLGSRIRDGRAAISRGAYLERFAMPGQDRRSTNVQPRSGAAALVRIAWMIGGVVAILTATLSIATQPEWTFGWRDGWLWFAVGATIWCRYIDISRFAGQTANGEPATSADLHRYVRGLLLSAAGLWLTAQAVAL